jgi:hypothetical protein
MLEKLSAWIIALPIGAILGWAGKKALGPSVDAFGAWLSDGLSSLVNREKIAHSAYPELEELISKNHQDRGHRIFSERKTYLRDRKITSFLVAHGSFVRQAIKNVWIEEARIDSYDESDIFFAGMELLFDTLRKKDLKKMFEKFKDNDQASLWPFLEFVEQKKPKLLSAEVIDYLRVHQREWEASQNQ